MYVTYEQVIILVIVCHIEKNRVWNGNKSSVTLCLCFVLNERHCRTHSLSSQQTVCDVSGPVIVGEVISSGSFDVPSVCEHEMKAEKEHHV